MKEIRYDYKPKISTSLLCIAFFGALAWMGFELASETDSGMTIKGWIELSAFEALVFSWLLFVCFLLMWGLGLLMLRNALTSKGQLILTQDTLQLPKNGFSKKTVTVSLADICEISAHKVYGNQFLHLVHTSGKLTINASMLPKGEAILDLTTHLFERIEATIESPVSRI